MEGGGGDMVRRGKDGGMEDAFGRIGHGHQFDHKANVVQDNAYLN